MQCPFDILYIDNSDVPSTKEQLVDESLEEAFLGGPQTPRPIFLGISASFKKEPRYGHGSSHQRTLLQLNIKMNKYFTEEYQQIKQIQLVEQELLTLPEHLSSSPVFSGVRVTRSLVLCVCFVDRCLSFCTFSFGHCVVCSSIYGF
jgi:hypothetical protein